LIFTSDNQHLRLGMPIIIQFDSTQPRYSNFTVLLYTLLLEILHIVHGLGLLIKQLATYLTSFNYCPIWNLNSPKQNQGNRWIRQTQ